MSFDTSTDQAPLDVLLRNRQAVLNFLERRVGDRALAEDVLRDAFVKVLARPGSSVRVRMRWSQRFVLSVSEVAQTLKAEYADALLSVEVNGTPVKTFAERHGLTATNAASAFIEPARRYVDA